MSRVRPIPELVLPLGLGNAARIKDLAKQRGIDVTRATERFTLEAALRRIFASSHAEKFGFITLKGGSLMYFSEGVEPLVSRPTRDIDIELSGYDGTLDGLKAILSTVLAEIPDPDDGVRFHVDALETNPVGEDRAVPGGSISCPVQIGHSIYAFKVDAGFHPPEDREDVIVRDYATLVPSRLSSFSVPCRPIEYALADKIQACARHGLANTRLRDYYDMTVFLTRLDIDPDLVAKAMVKTFDLYRQVMPENVDEFPALSSAFVESSNERWESMRESGQWPVPMGPLQEVVANLRISIQGFLERAVPLARPSV